MAEPEIVKVKVEPLTAEAFKPYGQVLEQKMPIFPEVDQGEGRVAMEILKTKPSKSKRIEEIAIHYSYNQTFIPLQEGSFILVVAPAPPKIGKTESEYPLEYNKLKAFLVEHGQAAIVDKGVWHTVSCIGNGCSFINVTRKDPGEKTSDQFAHPTMRGYVETVEFTKRDNKAIELEL